MNRFMLVFAFLLGVLATLVFPAATASPPPPEQTTIAIALDADRLFLLDHEEVVEEAHRLAQLRASYQAYADNAEAEALAICVRVRRGAVRYKPGLDSIFPAILSDVTYRRTDSNADGTIDKTDDIDAILVNADATGQ